MVRLSAPVVTGTTGSTQANQDFAGALRDALVNYRTVNNNQCWTEIANFDISSGHYHRVLKGIGDADVHVNGDTKIILEINSLGAGIGPRVKPYQDYAETGGAVGLRPAGSTLSDVNFRISPTNSTSYWITVNEYGFYAHVLESPSTWTMRFGGQPARTHVNQTQRGRAFSTAAVSAGSNVTVPIDRDMTTAFLSMTVGQEVWLLPLAQAGGGLPAFNFERATITAITASSITFATLASSKSVGTLIGDDPAPNFVGSNNAQYFCRASDGTYTSETAHQSITRAYLPESEGNVDPDERGLFAACYTTIDSTSEGYWGVPYLLEMWSNDGSPAPDPLTNVGRKNRDNGKQSYRFPSPAINGWLPGMGIGI